jgi:hypothetical protein
MPNMRRMKRSFACLAAGALLAAAGCATDQAPVPELPVDPSAPNHPFFHDEEVKDVFGDGNQLPPTLSVKLHACGKISYETLGRVLASRGVNLGNEAADSAGLLYRTGNLMLGAPSYEAKVAEALRSTTGGITRLEDILLAAAPELIANIGARPECQLDGQPARLFDDNGCNAMGLTCLIGAPVPQGTVSLCNEMVGRAADKTIGQQLAVAAIASAYFLCE